MSADPHPAMGAGSTAAWLPRLIWIVAGLLVTIAIQWATFSNLYATWWGSTAYNHCVLIAPISLFLIWQQRQRLSMLTPAVSYTAVVFVAANAVLWLLGVYLHINLLQHIAAVGSVIGVIWGLSGNPMASAILFPLVYLYFMVPEGDFLVPYLQDWTASVVVFLLRLTDLPVFLEGRYLQIPSGNFHVAKACSGINYLLATLAVGSVFAYLNYRSNWRRLAFMALAIVVPLVANGIRAYGIVMIAHLSDYRYAMGVDHFIYGWVFFGLVIFVLFAVGRTFSDLDAGPDYEFDLKPEAGTPSRFSQPASVMVLVVVCLLLPHFVVARSAQSIITTPVSALPRIAQWSGPVDAKSNLHSHFPGATRTFSAAYGDATQSTVILETAVYLAQGQGAELVNHANTVIDEEQWRLVSGEHTEATDVTAVPTVQARHVRSGNAERLVWWWYQLGNATTAGSMAAKLVEAWQKLRGDYRGGAIVVLSSDITNSSVEQGREHLRAFLTAMVAAGGAMPITGSSTGTP